MPLLETTGALLVTGGLGTVFGTLATKLIDHLGSRREAKANAAETITDAAGTLVASMTQLNNQLTVQVQQMRVAILLLTEVVDQIAPLVNAPADVIEKLKVANKAAKLAYIGFDDPGHTVVV